jgi:diketogulonate reductase-like aldo/keto reductase
LEQGAVTIPKSVTKSRLAANLDVFDFEISPEDMTVMNTWHDDTRVAWNPLSFG